MGSRIAAAVAVVALPLGMLSIWIAAYVGDTERYVATVAPLAQEPEVKAAVVAVLERETLQVLNSSEQLGATLRTLDLSCIGVDSSLLGGFADLANAFLGGTALGNTIRDQIEPQIAATVRRGITEAVASGTFERAWVAANRQAHRSVLAALEDRPAPANPTDQVLLPLTEVSAMVSGFIACPNLITPETARQIQSYLTLVDTDGLRAAHPAYQALQALRWVLPVLFVLGLLGALLTSVDRRRTGWQLGVGFVLGMGLLQLALVATKRSISSRGIDEEIFDAVWGALVHSLEVSMIVVAVVSAIGAVGLWFADDASRTTAVGEEER